MSAPITPGTGSQASLDDFVSYAPSRMCIYLPCKTMWPNASVDDRIPPQALLDLQGNPVQNAKGRRRSCRRSELRGR